MSECDLYYLNCNELRRLYKFYDIIIKVGDCKFPCHRIILASASEYFRAMFCGNFQEEKKKRVELKGIEAKDFELLLTYIYGGLVCFKTGNNVYRLLRISNYLNVLDASDLCKEYILTHAVSLAFGTVLNIFVFASTSENTPLTEEMAKILAKNFNAVFKNKQLLFISKMEIEKIFYHVEDQKLNVSDAGKVLDFMINWKKYHGLEKDLMYNWSNELSSTPELKIRPMKKITETTVSSNQLSLDEESDNISNQCDKSPMHMFANDDINTIETFPVQTDERNLPFCVFAKYPSKYSRISYDVSQYEFDDFYRLRHVGHLTDVCYSLKSCKSIFVDNNHFLFAVSTYHNLLSLQCTPYMGNMRRWSHFPMSSHNLADDPPYNLATVAFGRSVYLYNYGKFLMFNCETDKWTELSRNGPIKTTFPNLVCNNNCLYMIGGACIEGYADTKEKSFTDTIRYVEEDGRFFQFYDFREGLWRQLPSMTHSYSMLASCIHNDNLYVSGGENQSGCVEWYDFKAGKWSTLETFMPVPKNQHIQISYNNKLWFFGGSDPTWFSYDLKKNVWSNIFPNSAHSDHCTRFDHSILDVTLPYKFC